MSGYIGNVPTPQATQTRQSFTATASQTSFATLGYTPDFLDVFLNGVHLLNGTDYTATNGSDVVLTTGAAANDIVEVISYATFEVNSQNFTGDFTVDGSTFAVDSTNNRVGIGTTSPQESLHVSGAANQRLEIESTSSTFAAVTKMTTPDGSYGVLTSGGTLQFYDYTTAAERMRIDSSGNVGIGVSAPSALVHLDRGVTDGEYFRAGSNNRRWLKISSGTGDGSSLDALHDLNASGVSGVLSFSTNSTERMRIDSSGNVGIGTTSPDQKLHVSGSGSQSIRIENTNTNLIVGSVVGSIEFEGNDAGASGVTAAVKAVADSVTGDAALVFDTGTAGSASEAMRIDSSGNVLVGKTVASDSTAGISARSNGYLEATVNGGTVAGFNRQTSDGDIAIFRKDSTTVGSIGVNGNGFYIVGNNSAGIAITGPNSAFLPADGTGALADNSKDVGSLSVRFDDVYATNGTIQTSDANEKQDIAELDEAEKRVAVAAKGLLRKFRWKDAVAEKGDDARIHFGIIAQDLQAAFAAEGLDAGRYAMFISSTWWEHDGQTYETAEEAPEGATERTRLGVRYPELLAFIIGAM